MRCRFLLGLLAAPVQPQSSPQSTGGWQQPQQLRVGAPALPFALGLLLQHVGSLLLPQSTWEKIAAAFCEELNPISVQGAWPRNTLWMKAEEWAEERQSLEQSGCGHSQIDRHQGGPWVKQIAVLYRVFYEWYG